MVVLSHCCLGSWGKHNRNEDRKEGGGGRKIKSMEIHGRLQWWRWRGTAMPFNKT